MTLIVLRVLETYVHFQVVILFVDVFHAIYSFLVNDKEIKIYEIFYVYVFYVFFFSKCDFFTFFGFANRISIGFVIL